MKLACVSDLHGRYIEDPPDDTDIVIVAGDCTATDSIREWQHFSLWMESLRAPHKILVAGNHDGKLEDEFQRCRVISWMPSVTYLQDSGCNIEGIRFWGFPWTPCFMDWWFMASPEKMTEKLKLIPKATDVLISHGPPYGILDYLWNESHVGCRDLARRLQHHERMTHLICGHIHECGGQYQDMWFQTHDYEDGEPLWRAVQCRNVSHCNERYEPVTGWTVFEI